MCFLVLYEFQDIKALVRNAAVLFRQTNDVCRYLNERWEFVLIQLYAGLF